MKQYIRDATKGYDNLKVVPVQDFIDEGWLQEANRQFFHPRGTALTIVTDQDKIRNYLIELLEWAKTERQDSEGGKIDQSWIEYLKKGMFCYLGDFRPEGIEFGKAMDSEQASIRLKKADNMSKVVIHGVKSVDSITQVEGEVK